MTFAQFGLIVFATLVGMAGSLAFMVTIDSFYRAFRRQPMSMWATIVLGAAAGTGMVTGIALVLGTTL